MADVDVTSTADVADVAEVSTTEVDLSAVPEKFRDHVDKDKYSKDPDYKRAKDHGHVPLEVWTADGKDPDKWVGPKAFNKVFDDMKYRREISDELKENKKLAQTLLKTWEDDKMKAVQDALKVQVEQLKQAIEDGDAKRAVELSSQINQQKAQAPQQQAQVTPPVIARFVANNPTINPDSPDFDKDYADSVWAQALEYGNQLKNQYGGKDLSPFDVKGILEEVMSMNKPPEKPKAPAKAPAVAAPNQSKANSQPKLSTSERKTYEMIKTMKDGDKKAAAFLKNLQSN